MNKKIIPVIGILVIIATAFIILFGFKNSITTTSLPSSTQDSTISVKQVVVFSDKKKVTKELNPKSGTTALDLIKSTHKVEVKKYSFGTIAESIDGIKNGSNKKYWIYFVNGNESKIGADSYKIKNGDTIEWKFKEYEQNDK